MSESKPDFSIKPVHDVLYVQLSGSWNHDLTADYSLEYKKQTSRYFAREWACVLNLQNLDMIIPEREQIETFRALNTWSYIKGMTALAIVISLENRHQLLYQFEEIFQDPQPYRTAIFYSDEEASAWLESQNGIKVFPEQATFSQRTA